MNTKMAVGIGVLVLVAAGASIAAQYIHLTPGTTPLEVFAPVASTSDTSEAGGAGSGASSAQPSFTQGAPVKKVVHTALAFDKPTYTSSTPYPTFAGSGSNIASGQILIEDSNGTGLESAAVTITNGRWSYSSSRALSPGTYTVFFGNKGGLIVAAKLIVS